MYDYLYTKLTILAIEVGDFSLLKPLKIKFFNDSILCYPESYN